MGDNTPYRPGESEQGSLRKNFRRVRNFFRYKDTSNDLKRVSEANCKISGEEINCAREIISTFRENRNLRHHQSKEQAKEVIKWIEKNTSNWLVEPDSPWAMLLQKKTESKSECERYERWWEYHVMGSTYDHLEHTKNANMGLLEAFEAQGQFIDGLLEGAQPIQVREESAENWVEDAIKSIENSHDLGSIKPFLQLMDKRVEEALKSLVQDSWHLDDIDVSGEYRELYGKFNEERDYLEYTLDRHIQLRINESHIEKTRLEQKSIMQLNRGLILLNAIKGAPPPYE